MEKKEKKQKIISGIVAFVLMLGLVVVGAVLLKQKEHPAHQLPGVLLVVTAAANVIAYFANLQRGKDRHRILQTLSDLRDRGEEAGAELEQKLDRAAFFTDLYTLYFTVLVLLSALMLSANPGLAIFVLAGLQNLLYRFWPEKQGPEMVLPALEAEYPQQYALARKAQQAVGVEGPVEIGHSDGFTASVLYHRGRAYLLLGALLIDNLSREELYQVMLHEFGHIQNQAQLRREQHMKRREAELFLAVDTWEGEAFALHQIFASRAKENYADGIIRQKGNAEAAAGAFAKIAYYDYYERDFLRSGESIHFFCQEEVPDHWITLLSRDFRRAVEQDPQAARNLLDRELQPRVSTHPIMRHRIQALGASEYTVSFPTHEGPWGQEVQRTMDRVDAYIRSSNQDNYGENRQKHYLQHQKTIEAWQAAGEPLTYETTRDVLDALYVFQRFQDIIDLSRRFAETGASESERCHAIFVEGRARLRLMDHSGIAVLYRAMENNRNYEDAAAEAIGDYCITLGLEEELNHYRRYGDALMARQVDLEPDFPILPRNRLEPVTDASEPFAGNLERILQVGRNQLSRVFLVKKHTSPTTHVYIYLLEFLPDATPEQRDEIYDRIFMHLDKQETQYALGHYEEGNGKNWLEKRPGYLIYRK